MTDNLQLNLGSGGAKLKTQDDGTSHWQQVLMAFGETSLTTIEKASPLPVDPQAITSAKTSLDTSTALAATSSADLNSAQISVGTTGQLIGLIITSSVPLKAVLKTLLNGAESADKAVFFTQIANNQPIIMPSKLFFTQAYDAGVGLDGFRVTVTNLDGTAASDVYCTFLYDEV